MILLRRLLLQNRFQALVAFAHDTERLLIACVHLQSIRMPLFSGVFSPLGPLDEPFLHFGAELFPDGNQVENFFNGFEVGLVQRPFQIKDIDRANVSIVVEV